MPQTDLRVIKTLRQIDNALLTLLSDMPFEKITVDLLCQVALVNRSTFYKYYKSKFDLMDQYLSRTLTEFREQMDVAFINASSDNIHNLVYQKNSKKPCNLCTSIKKLYLLLWNLPLETPVFSRMVQVVHNNILEKLAAPSTQNATA